VSNKTLDYVQIDGVGHYARTRSEVKSQLVHNHRLDLGPFRHYEYSYCNTKMSGAGKGKGKNRQTRFPVARIKRIMQKDEEVGKVAQATPVVICERHCRINRTGQMLIRERIQQRLWNCSCKIWSVHPPSYVKNGEDDE
jgi:hypothetical protein